MVQRLQSRRIFPSAVVSHRCLLEGNGWKLHGIALHIPLQRLDGLQHCWVRFHSGAEVFQLGACRAVNGAAGGQGSAEEWLATESNQSYQNREDIACRQNDEPERREQPTKADRCGRP